LSLVVFLGLTASWCGVGVNLPILTEIVRPEGRSTILAWEAALESTFATILGNAMVGFLAETVFGYKLADAQGAGGGQHVADVASRKALGKALTLTCFVPWIICWLAYTMLHWSYPADLRRVRRERCEEYAEELRLHKLGEQDGKSEASPNEQNSVKELEDENPVVEEEVANEDNAIVDMLENQAVEVHVHEDGLHGIEEQVEPEENPDSIVNVKTEEEDIEVHVHEDGHQHIEEEVAEHEETGDDAKKERSVIEVSVHADSQEINPESDSPDKFRFSKLFGL